MYNIAPQFIRDYITKNFSNIGKLSANGREFIMESLFIENDYKRHMSINIDSGLWQCFKTGRTGNFVRFYAEAENLPYFKAYKDLLVKNFCFLGDDTIPDIVKEERQLELDTDSLIPLNVASGFSEDPKILNAWNILFSRKLFNESNDTRPEYYLCLDGKFRDRIIIPFSKDGVVFYFQARATGDQRPKYLNPSTEIAPNPSEILYPYDEDADHLVVCEGPLDAISLQLQGVNATATMKNTVSPRQAEILSTFQGKIILGFDNDAAGKRGIQAFERLRKERRMNPFYVCDLPNKCKDWNDAHIKGVSLPQWVTEKSSLYNFDYKVMSEINLL